MKTYIDGIETAEVNSSAVDPSSIDHVEVIRGPEAATLYGADAIGGVIQIFTKRGGSSDAHLRSMHRLRSAQSRVPIAGTAVRSASRIVRRYKVAAPRRPTALAGVTPTILRGCRKGR